jgi:hypothetical protein
MPKRRPTDADVRLAVWMAYRRHARRMFPLPHGPAGDALRAAVVRGWITIGLALSRKGQVESAIVTDEGRKAIADYTGETPNGPD